MVSDKKPANSNATSNNTTIVIAIVAAVVLVAIGAWMVFANKKEPTTSHDHNKMMHDMDHNMMRSGTDGTMKFSVNPHKTRVQVLELRNGDLSRTPGEGKQLVTVEVQVKNNGDDKKSLFTMNQVLITKSGERVKGDAGLQMYVANGTWYEDIPAKGAASGTLVFEIGADERVDSIELHSVLGSKGAKINLKLN